jgi:hypothetical protein
VSDSIPPLDPRLLEPLRESERAPADVRARAWHRLMTAVAGLGPGGAEDSGTRAQARRAGALGTPAAGVALLAFAVGTAVGAGLYAVFAPVPPARVVYVDRVEVPPASSPAPTLPPEETATTSSARAASVSPPPSASSAHASQLSAERMMLDEARAALAQGDPLRAIGRLERHRRTFPSALLGEERDAMWVQALAKAGRYDEARARATAFRKHSPDSLFASVVDSAIESIP